MVRGSPKSGPPQLPKSRSPTDPYGDGLWCFEPRVSNTARVRCPLIRMRTDCGTPTLRAR